MTEKFNPIDKALEELNFTDKEKEAFHEIIRAVKTSQNVASESPKNKIDLIIEEAIKS